ncbi:MAG TPA: prepilin-type N-terminal cleavage/methylation domain-containing protein [Rhizomicrobium sp.]
MRTPQQKAFTLLEVMFAITIFFMAMFAILGVFSAGLHSAMLLRKDGPTAGMIASELSLTNEFDEGTMSGTFGDTYPSYRWTADVTEAATNGLYRLDINVLAPEGTVASAMSILLYRPESANSQGKLGKTASWGRH